MNFSKFFKLSGVLFAASLLCYTLKAQNPALDLARSVYPQAASVSMEKTVCHAIKDKNGKVLGYEVSSKPYTGNIEGYAGPTPVVLILDAHKRIVKLCLLSNSESPDYVAKLTRSGFLNKWNGKTLKQAANMQVDAVSGATYTSHAIQKNVSIAAQQALNSK
jgi:uncharacterized protein with FMN-binding domain